jgi:hypothetical protein
LPIEFLRGFSDSAEDGIESRTIASARQHPDTLDVHI